MAFGFTSNKHNYYIGCSIVFIDGISSILVLFAYFQLYYHITMKGSPLNWQFNSMIFAIIHICMTILLFIHDIYFKSDEAFCLGVLSPIDNVSETSCIQTNPWALYRKHYIIFGFKIVFLALDIAVLILFNDGWKCIQTICS